MPVVESVTTDSVSGANPTFDMPATRPDGDLYVLVVVNDDFNDPDQITEPAGWTQIELRQNPGGDTLGGLVAWKVGDSEPASYQLGTISTFEGGTVVVRISGVDASTPINVHSFAASDSGSSVVAPDVTTTVDETLVLRFYLSDGATFTSVPATEEFNFEPTPATSPMAGSSETGPNPAGSTGTASATMSAGDNSIAFTVAVAAVAAEKLVGRSVHYDFANRQVVVESGV